MKRLESRKLHSLWWDSHINPKNSRWLAENLEEMDHTVKRMLKLIEDDGDSFAKKAEMYYRKRPELVSHVEEFYRMYRFLAERYDHLTIELRKSIPSDLQSQGSGTSELGYESPSPLASSDLRIARRRSGPQAAGFDVFLGAGGSSSDNFQREVDESSSITDSEPDCDASSVNNYSMASGNGTNQALLSRVFDLENELLDMKEKLVRVQNEYASNAPPKEGNHSEDPSSLRVTHEEELRIAKEKARLYEEEISSLKVDLEKYTSESLSSNLINGQSEVTLVEELKKLEGKLQVSNGEILSLKRELEVRRSPENNQKMSDQLELAEKDAAAWRAKFNTQRREVTKLQDRLSRLKNSLTDRDHEIRELKIAVSDAEEKIFPEKSCIKAKIARLVEERVHMEEQLREWESRGRAMEEEIRKAKSEMLQMEERLTTLIDQLKADIIDRDCRLLDLMRRLDAAQLEKSILLDQVLALKADVSSKASHLAQVNEHMHHLVGEHAQLTAASDRAYGMVEGLSLRVEELERESEKQRVAILEGAEEKREAIRQLCFSLEHYRSGYQELRLAFSGHNNKQFRRTSVAY